MTKSIVLERAQHKLDYMKRGAETAKKTLQKAQTDYDEWLQAVKDEEDYVNALSIRESVLLENS